MGLISLGIFALYQLQIDPITWDSAIAIALFLIALLPAVIVWGVKKCRKGRFRPLRGQTGFTLIEVLVAVGILGFIGVGVLTALDTNFRAVRTLDERVVAANLATAHFEAISKSTYAANYDGVVANITIPAQYEVNYSVSFSNDGHEWSDTYSSETLQKITVFVSHQGKPVLSMCTFKAEK